MDTRRSRFGSGRARHLLSRCRPRPGAVPSAGAPYERNSSLPPQIGSTWRNLYKLYQAGGLEAFFEATSTVDQIDPQTHVLDTRLRDYLQALRTRDCLPEVNGTVTRLDAEPNDILD